MIYKIWTEKDLTGAKLVVRFPEEEIDRKALYTLQTETPDFLLPFRYRSVDGQAECTYQIGDYSKLQYRFGRHSAEEGVLLWDMLLRPLLECGDWFLKPFSFALDAQYIYASKDGKRIGYLYIPSKQDCVDHGDLKNLVEELAKKNPIEDTNLENQILRAVMQDFQPKTFLKMLHEFNGKPATAASIPENQPTHGMPAYMEKALMPQKAEAKGMNMKEELAVAAAPAEKTPVRPMQDFDDIVIDLDGEKKDGKKTKGKGLLGWREKQETKKTQKSGLFGKKEKKQKEQKEIILGAAERVPMPEGLRQSDLAAPVYAPLDEASDATQLDESCESTHLRLVGDMSLPKEILVEIEVGGAFTIGRFDVSVGHAQSDFEFARNTKAVSRRHAAIEREADGGYVIVDLSSTAGTFVNGQRLTANMPCRLERGCRVAFGTSGAEYIWEEK